jgi:hypothetical protein
MLAGGFVCAQPAKAAAHKDKAAMRDALVAVRMDGRIERVLGMAFPLPGWRLLSVDCS